MAIVGTFGFISSALFMVDQDNPFDVVKPDGNIKLAHNRFQIFCLVFFFNDMASEMVYPIVPIFLTTILKVSTPVVGLIEGIAEATAAVGKFIFGYLSDKIGRRKPFVISGYSFSTISKNFIGLSNAWPLVLL